MNNLKKLGRLWPLFLITIAALIVLILSLKSILSSYDSVNTDSTEPINVTLTQTSNIQSQTDTASSPSAVPVNETPLPTENPVPSVSSAAPAELAPAASVVADAEENIETTASIAEESQSADASASEPAANVIIDNTIHEYTDNYSHTEEGTSNEASIAAQIISLVNQERNNNGLAGLSYDDNLAYVASIRAMEVSSIFSHTRPNGEDCFSAFPGGYAFMGENLASADGIISDSDFASGCVKWWMQSEGHRENILNGTYTNTAVGIYISGGAMYAVQLFGTPQ